MSKLFFLLALTLSCCSSTDTDSDADAGVDADSVDASSDSDHSDAEDARSDGDFDRPRDAEPDTTFDADRETVVDADRDDESASDTERILMIGNSYTASNNLAGLLESLLETVGPDVTTDSVTGGGYRLEQHAADADGRNGETHLRTLLVTSGVRWDVVVLQEQSQIPGFPESEPAWRAMVDGGEILRDLATARGADVVLLLTWGRRDGDEYNPAMYPDFLTMQDRLTGGYTRLAELLTTSDARIVVAPAGEAFRAVHAAGDVDAFNGLYSGDGSHPSARGSYLAACVLLATLTGRSPVGIEWAPAGLSAEERDGLQAVAAEVVLGPSAPDLWRR